MTFSSDGTAPLSFGVASESVNFTSTGTYSLWTQIVMNFEGAGEINFNQDNTVTSLGEAPGEGVPEPGSLLLIATGAMALVRAQRRRSSANRAI
jgi:hypothetical protein